MRRVLIVNADDYGLSPGVDQGIREAAAAGVVTSVSVLVAGATHNSIRALRDAAPGVGLGLHTDLTSDLVHPLPGDAARRVAEQVDRFVDLVGRRPDHIDTHKHVHRGDPDVLAALASHGVPVRANGAVVRRALRSARVRCTDHFVGDVGRQPYWTSRRLWRVVLDLAPGTTELMCHPGRHDDLPGPLTYRAQRATELRTFTSPRLRARITALGIRLATFATLAAPEKRPCD